MRRDPSQHHRRVQSAPLSSSSSSTSFSQGLEGHYKKPEYGPQAFVDRDGEEQSLSEYEDISIEELAEGEGEDTYETEVLRPDVYEDADSVRANEAGDQGYAFQNDSPHQGGIIEGLRTLHCGSDEDELVADEGREKRKKRRSPGMFKRSHSQSIGNDKDEEPPDAHGLERTTRRLRRRVKGPGDDIALEGTRVTEVECEEFEDVVPMEKAPNESDMDDYSTESMSVGTTEDAMEID